MSKTNFIPQVNGFHFGNHFVNNILQLPVYGQITSLGRCGGMSYAALDFYNTHRSVPPSTDQDFASTGSVPPDGTPLADYIYRRQLDSFLVPSAVKFITWSVTPDGSSFLLRGVESWTKQDEFAKLRAAVDAGKPVPLGLIVATDLSGLPHNHQVVAYGYDVDAAGNLSRVELYDNNHPNEDVTLTPESNGPGWRESTGERWRGFFIQDYIAQQPPSTITAGPPAGPVVEKALLPVQTKPFIVTFDSIRFDGDKHLKNKGRVALTFSVNGAQVRWPRSGVRIVKAGQSYDIAKSLAVDLSPDDRLTVRVSASDALLGDVLIGDNDAPGAVLTQEFSQSEGWGKGRHKSSAVGAAGGYTVKYTIKPRNI